MIVKFDHISYIEERSQEHNIIKKKGKPVFKEINLRNLSIKSKLMKKNQATHDLYFYESDFPMEYIFYDYVNRKSDIFLKDGKVYGLYSNKKNAIDFLIGIFGEKVQENDDEIICNMKGILDKQDYILILRKTESTCASFLDDSGYGVLTLVTSSKFSKIPDDGICTETEMLEINGKELDICFTRSESTNVIFEIIKIRSR